MRCKHAIIEQAAFGKNPRRGITSFIHQWCNFGDLYGDDSRDLGHITNGNQPHKRGKVQLHIVEPLCNGKVFCFFKIIKEHDGIVAYDIVVYLGFDGLIIICLDTKLFQHQRLELGKRSDIGQVYFHHGGAFK